MQFCSRFGVSLVSAMKVQIKNEIAKDILAFWHGFIYNNKNQRLHRQDSQDKEESDDEGKIKTATESSDSEDDDEGDSRRGRFKSERKNVVSLTKKAPSGRRDIPETLGE